MRGKLKFMDPETVRPGQNVQVFVLDTSRADASATEVFKKTVKIPEDFDAALDDLSFEMDFSGASEGLTVRAHLVQHEGSDVRTGDLITTASIPVPQDAHTEVVLPLKRV